MISKNKISSDNQLQNWSVLKQNKTTRHEVRHCHLCIGKSHGAENADLRRQLLVPQTSPLNTTGFQDHGLFSLVNADDRNNNNNNNNNNNSKGNANNRLVQTRSCEKRRSMYVTKSPCSTYLYRAILARTPHSL